MKFKPKAFRRLAICGAMLLAGGVTAAAASGPPGRLVSINLCTDALLIALAEPVRIAAVSRLARHPELSFVAERAKAFAIVRGLAEEVLRLGPDLVLAGAFSSAATRATLAAHGVRIETFAPPLTIAEAKAEIAHAATLTGDPGRGAALVAEIDGALAAARAATAVRPISAIALERRGYASGRDTLLGDIMRQTGLTNAAERLGIGSVEQVPLEAVLKARPDVLIVEAVGEGSPDQGTALLRHPALLKAVPPGRRIAIPAAELSCGGPSLAAAIRRLAREVERIRRGGPG